MDGFFFWQNFCFESLSTDSIDISDKKQKLYFVIHLSTLNSYAQ